MASLYNDHGQHPGRNARTTAWWRQPVFLGLVGVGVLFAALVLHARLGRRPAPDQPGDALVGQAPQVAQTPGGSQRLPSRGHPGAPQPAPTPAAALRASQPVASPARLDAPAPRAGSLDALVARVNQSAGGLTRDDANAIHQMLQAVQAQGAAAVPTLRDLLRRVELRPLRLTLVDMLYQIGGSDAIDVSLEQLHRAADPVEIAQLGWYLEQVAPGAYREEILQAARETLQWAAHIPPEHREDMSPLFALLQAYGGSEVVADLERYRPTWWEYALMALAALPAGEGVQNLAALAGDPNVPLAYKPKFPFRMLAQASVYHPEAGVALLELARADQIPEQAWSQVGAALEGKHLQFSSQLVDGTPLQGHRADVSGVEALLAREDDTKPRTVSYAQQFAAAQWSAEQINQQLALIDKLLDVTDSSVAVQALRQARDSLRHGRH